MAKKCEECDGTGFVNDEDADPAPGDEIPQVECEECAGTGEITDEEDDVEDEEDEEEKKDDEAKS